MNDQIVGSWSGPFEGHEYKITLRPDGKCETQNTKYSFSEKGTYEFSPPDLLIRYYQGGSADWRVVSCDANRLELYSDQIRSSIRFTRQAGEATA